MTSLPYLKSSFSIHYLVFLKNIYGMIQTWVLDLYFL